jgi:4-aminobutyrate aminotransferase-like enzyme/Ser/Thr protein kinase RdoA (MazF antagonist)
LRFLTKKTDICDIQQTLRMTYKNLLIACEEAEQIALKYYGIAGKASLLAGEIDFNFKITADTESYILKVSRSAAIAAEGDLQQDILQYLATQNTNFIFPEIVNTLAGESSFNWKSANGTIRTVKMLKWISGRLFADVKPVTDHLRYTLGQKGGQITQALLGFDSPLAQKTFDWDIAQGLWVENYFSLFSKEEKELVAYFLEKFKEIAPIYNSLRKSVIHNDANDNNIVVDENLVSPEVKAIIDYGDAVYSQTINDLSVSLAYAMMHCEQPLQAAVPTVSGYHAAFPLLDIELKVLFTTIAMRLLISVTKSAINKQKEPENTYLQISEKPAWALLKKWKEVSPDFAYYTFRHACGLEPCEQNATFKSYAASRSWEISDLIPEAKYLTLADLDLSIGSQFVGHYSEYISSEKIYDKISEKFEKNEELLVGGYGEARPVYTTDAYKIRQNEGFEHRTRHLGVDFWTHAQTPICAIEDGEIFASHNNDQHKDYGPTLILKHQVGDLEYYTLYGHLTVKSLENKTIGQKVKKGQKIGEIGAFHENGAWAPHLHFQVVLDMLGLQNDFYGVSLPSLWPVFSSICPDPNLFFKLPILEPKNNSENEHLLKFRKEHLGKSLSLSYQNPLKIVRGQQQYLIDDFGQKYLDTVNNVAHVGHEHPRVVAAGERQMAVLNTNTRYLHAEILDFAEALLKTLPEELSVLHFVNSGSEANELAMRMAKAFTGQKDMIALEHGYHGNTQACIDVSSYKFDGKGGSGCPEHTHIIPLPDAFRGIYRGEGAGAKYAKHVEESIEELKSKGRNVAGFIAESIVSCGGQIDLPSGFLSEAYAFVKQAGGVCISDEVQVGFGRVGAKFWGFELHGVVPDIVTMGKPIGNGHPLAAVACTKEVAEAFANGMEFFNTFGGNPVSCAIGREVLAVIKDEKLQENAAEVGEFLKAELNALKAKFPILKDIRGEGLFLGVELCDDQLNPLAAQTNYLANRMKDFKILMSVDGPDHNVLKIKPPMCFSKENAEYMLECLKRVLSEDFMSRGSSFC